MTLFEMSGKGGRFSLANKTNSTDQVLSPKTSHVIKRQPDLLADEDMDCLVIE